MRMFRPFAVALLAAIPAAAQTPPAPAAAMKSATTISATGCLERGLAGHAGAAAGMDADTMTAAFVLTHAKLHLADRGAEPAARPTSTPAGAPVSSHEGTQATNTQPGPAGSGPPSATPTRSGRRAEWRLTAATGVDLAAHVGHRVLVTGTLSGAAPNAGDTAVPRNATLEVARVSVIATSCTSS